MISVIGIIGAISIIGYNSLLSALCSLNFAPTSILFPLFSFTKTTLIYPSPFSNYLVFRLAGRMTGTTRGEMAKLEGEEMAAQAGGKTGKVCRKRYAGKG